MSTLRVGLVARLFAGAAFILAASLAAAQTTNDYTALVGSSGYTGFQQQNAPGSAAVSGEPGVTTVRTSHSGLSLSKVKIFVPPGTIRFKVSAITYRVDQDARAVARFGVTPTATYSDVGRGTGVSDERKSLDRLLAGEELKFYAEPNAGVLTISGAESTAVTPSASGGYIYLNFLSLPGGELLSFQTYADVQTTCYANWYANASWDQAGNPVAGASHTCSGSTGGSTPTTPGTAPGNGGPFTFTPADLVVGSVETTTITPSAGVSLPAVCTSSTAYATVSGKTVQLSFYKSGIKAPTPVQITCGTYSASLTVYPPGATPGNTALTGIALSSDTLNAGVTSVALTIQPQPSTAALPQCTASNSGYLTVSGSQISLGALAAGLTAIRTETVTCGTFTKTVTIKPAGSFATVATEVTTAADGKLTLRLTLKQPVADVAPGITTNVFVGAYLPPGVLFGNQAKWFFKTPTIWSEVNGLDISALAFSRNQASAVEKVYTVPLEFSASDFKAFGIEIHFGYVNSNGVFVNLGKVWSATN